ncbi:MAG: hypothetical protein H6R24_541 [Proteobacteria bacterium]|nr:hypothetical protein [Pseudomonadota bacterium]
MTHPLPTGLTREQKDAFKNARPPARAQLTDKDKVGEVLGPIREKLNAGWSYEEVRQELARTVGFKGTRRTLYNYVWQLSAVARQATPAAPAPAETAASEEDRAGAGAPPPQPASACVPDPARRHFIQNLGGPVAREARRQRTDDQPQRPSLVEILNKTL